MGYYGYHQVNKHRIKNGEMVEHYFTDDYPGIGESLVLVLSTAPFLRPIRPHKWPEYVDILADWRRGNEPALSGDRREEKNPA